MCPGAKRRSHRRDVQRAREEILRVGEQRVAHALGRARRSPLIASPSSPTAVISRQPILSASLWSLYAMCPVRATGASEHPLEPQDRQPSLPVAQARGGRANLERQLPPVHREDEVVGECRTLPRRPGRELGRRHGPIAVRVDRGLLLERRDLRHVDHVVDPDLAGHHVDAAVEVHGEVAQGMRGRAAAGHRTATESNVEERQAPADGRLMRAPPSFASVRMRDGRVLDREVWVDVERLA